MPKGRRGKTHGIMSTYQSGCRCDLCGEAMRTYKRDYYSRNPGAWRRYEIRKKYDLSDEEFDALADSQGGLCAICGKPPARKRLDIDHCHTTLAVRGLLCRSCNGKLGWYEIHRAAVARYLLEGEN